MLFRAMLLSLGLSACHVWGGNKVTTAARSQTAQPKIVTDPWLQVAKPTTVFKIPSALKDVNTDSKLSAKASCSWQPPVASTVTCAQPPAEIVQRAVDLANQRKNHKEVIDETMLTFGCKGPQGWLASFMLFDDDNAGTSRRETWMMSPKAEPKSRNRQTLETSLDIDGDGSAESVTVDSKGVRTVWFDGGKKPVRVKQRGQWQPWQGGFALVDIDGDLRSGFVVTGGHAFLVTAKGVTPRQDLLVPMWRTTRAAHCAVDTIILGSVNDESEAEQDLAISQTCRSAMHAVAKPKELKIIHAIVERVRARGTLLTNGEPRFSWSCSEKNSVALVRYCQGDAGEGCDWTDEIWIELGPSMHMAYRSQSSGSFSESIANEEWSFVADGDFDGDGQLDPVIRNRTTHGESDLHGLSFGTVVHGQLHWIVQYDSRVFSKTDNVPVSVRLPGANVDHLVIKDIPRSDEYESPTADKVWKWRRGDMRIVDTKEAVKVLEKAALDAPPPAPAPGQD
jgi:hypothetical protein